MTRRILGTLMVTVAVAACGHDVETHQPADVNPGPTMTLTAEVLPTFVPVDGSVRGVRRASLATRMMARVTAVEVDVGSRVAAGQVLVRLGVDDITVNRAKAEAALQAARAAHAEAARHVTRMDTLYQQDAVARVQLDQARLQLTQAASQLAIAEATIQEVEAADRYATIRAPFAGAVVRRGVDVGDLAAPGMPLLVVEGNGLREAVLAVPADAASGMHGGALITVRGPEGRETRAPVRAVAAGADPMTRTVEVRIEIPTDWPTGIAVTALIPTGSAHGIAIPSTAVVRRGQLTGVRVLTADGPVLRWVRLGRTLPGETAAEHGRVEVLSGLEPGERILL